MTDSASPYSLKPWLQHYGSSIPETLAPPAAPHLAAMAREAARRYSAQTAFTCVMPNGMYGSLS
jgi:long-chain acyl-CoA synthetase